PGAGDGGRRSWRSCAARCRASSMDGWLLPLGMACAPLARYRARSTTRNDITYVRSRTLLRGAIRTISTATQWRICRPAARHALLCRRRLRANVTIAVRGVDHLDPELAAKLVSEPGPRRPEMLLRSTIRPLELMFGQD